MKEEDKFIEEDQSAISELDESYEGIGQTPLEPYEYIDEDFFNDATKNDLNMSTRSMKKPLFSNKLN